MSEDGRKHDYPTDSKDAVGSQSGSQLRVNKLKLSQNRLRSNRPCKTPRHAQHPPSLGISNTHNADIETPKRRAPPRYLGSRDCDSPSDGEVQQDIIWDPMSPPPSTGRGKGRPETRVIQISDIANRIAPKDARPVQLQSPIMQWIEDASVLCTPEVRPPRPSRMSTRRSNVEDLMKLARQFDINMHNQARESVKNTTNTPHPPSDSSKPGPAPWRASGGSVSRSQQTEAELQALFDGPTQQVSGRLSQGSTTSTGSPDAKGQPGVSRLTTQGPEVQSARSGPVQCPGKEELLSTSVAVTGEDFDEDWGSDDFLDNETLLLEVDTVVVGQGAGPEPSSCDSSRTNTDRGELARKSLLPSFAATPRVLPPGVPAPAPAVPARSLAVPAPGVPPAARSSLLDLCPKPRPSNRSTFMLDSDPSIQGQTAATQPSLTGLKSHPNPTAPTRPNPTTKTRPNPHPTTQTRPNPHHTTQNRPNPHPTTQNWPNPDPTTSNPIPCQGSSRLDQGGSRQGQGAPTSRPVSSTAATCEQKAWDSTKGILTEDLEALFDSDSAWDDGLDDQLLYQVCERVERISNSQPEPQECRGGQGDERTNGTSDRPPHVYARSTSAPGPAGGGTKNPQRLSVPVPVRASGSQRPPGPSRSYPGPGSGFTQIKSALPGGHGAVIRPSDAGRTSGAQQPTVSTSNAQNSNSHHAPLKRPLTDSVAMNNKVFVAGPTTGRCSAAEIERKKQEALARRRSRILASQSTRGARS